jgi:hypothetical protein
MRAHWRGLAGGEQAWTAVDDYFTDLDRAQGTRSAPHA